MSNSDMQPCCVLDLYATLEAIRQQIEILQTWIRSARGASCKTAHPRSPTELPGNTNVYEPTAFTNSHSMDMIKKFRRTRFFRWTPLHVQDKSVGITILFLF